MVMPTFWFGVWALLTLCASAGIGGLVGMVAKPAGGRYFGQDRSSLVVGIVVSALCGIALSARAVYHRREGVSRLRASIPLFDRMPSALRTSALAAVALVCVLTGTVGPIADGSAPAAQTTQDGSDLAATVGVECVLGVIVLLCAYRLYRRVRPGAPPADAGDAPVGQH